MKNFNIYIAITTISMLSGCALERRGVAASGNVTQTCAYNTLKEMDGITKVYVCYDQNYWHGHPRYVDGLEFETNDFWGTVVDSRVTVYSPGGFSYRYFALWNIDEIAEERQRKAQKLAEEIGKLLRDHCHK